MQKDGTLTLPLLIIFGSTPIIFEINVSHYFIRYLTLHTHLLRDVRLLHNYLQQGVKFIVIKIFKANF